MRAILVTPGAAYRPRLGKAVTFQPQLAIFIAAALDYLLGRATR
jgi:hypothetical protein